MRLYPESIENELKLLEPKLCDYLLTPSQPTNQIISHIIASGGKRIRPGLFLLCCDLIKYNGEHRFPIAAVCEYIHTASLLHDDVIDNSQERRGKPTVNSKWGDETAVLSGDLIYAAACRLMVKTASLDLIDTFAECIRFMSESELFQLELLWKASTSRSDYLRVISGKTACLFAAASQTPAFLGGQPADVSQALGAFGQSLGMAFQIADDCLDYTANQTDFGKPAVSDLFEGKVTLPLLIALESASHAQRQFVEEILEGAQTKTPENQSRLQDFVITRDGVANSYAFAETQLASAFLALEQLAKSGAQLDLATLDHLKNLAKFVLARNH
jgi:octaprenyl-diphosphate synthase